MQAYIDGLKLIYNRIKKCDSILKTNHFHIFGLLLKRKDLTDCNLGALNQFKDKNAKAVYFKQSFGFSFLRLINFSLNNIKSITIKKL